MIGAVRRLGVDHRRSALTGWTRAHHELVADRQLLALRPWASPGRARFDLPGPASKAGAASDGLEAFARSFLTAGFRLAGGAGDPHDHAGWYAAGLAAGSDPHAPDRWPRMSEVRQARVEAAALAIGLHESRRMIWDRLDSSVQERLVDWLSESIGGGYGDNNWKWFANVTQAFLRSVGGPYSADEIEANLDFLDGCYLGDGWYSDGHPDGRNGNIDWYNAWVMHLFALWYCRILGADAPNGLLDTSRERLAQFLPQALALFGSDGAPLFQGRSLVYRFATTGALWAGPVFGVDTVAPGAVRAVGSRALRYFVEHGAFDDHDLLSLGWQGRFEPMRQPYSGPGSPYWSGLGFAGLVLGDDHPLWTAPESELDLDAAGRVTAARPPGWTMGHADGIVRVINHRVDHSGSHASTEDPQYCRYGYSSVTAPVPLPAGDGDRVVDNQVSLIDDDGRWSQRRPIDDGAVEGTHGWSRQTARFRDGDDWRDGPQIAVATVLRGAVEVRLVQLASSHSGRLVISGFAVPAGERELVSAVHPLLGDLRQGTTQHEVANPFGDRLVVPWVDSGGPISVGEVYAAAVVLGRATPDLPTLELGKSAVVITWPDGVVDEVRFDDLSAR